jgi:beta-lactamase regulating signal transducer with metallopeptidase domain
MIEWKIIASLLRTLLIMSVTGSIISLFLFAFKPLIKNHIPKAVQYYLWTLVLVALLVPFSLFVSIPVNTPITPVHEIVKNNIKTNTERYEEISQQKYNVPFEKLEAENQVKVIYESKGWLNNYLLTLPFTIGVAIFIITIFQYLGFARKLRRSRIPAKNDEVIMLKQLHKEIRKPHLYRNRLAPTPMLIGIFRPVILLPDKEFSNVQLQNILLHELTHWRRHDIVVKWISILARSLHWFNPLVYFVCHEIDRASELACDEAVIKSLDANGKQSYGNTLIDMVADSKTSKTILSTTMCEEKKALKERLGAIMKHKVFSAGAIAFSCILAVAILCGMLVLGAENINKVTVPIVTLYAGDGSDWSIDTKKLNSINSRLKADTETGIISLPDSVEIQVTYRDYIGKSRVRIYCSPLNSTTEPRNLGGAFRDVFFGADDVKNTTVWLVMEDYPGGFDGYVWAVVTGSDGIEHTSDLLRIVYNPVSVDSSTNNK